MARSAADTAAAGIPGGSGGHPSGTATCEDEIDTTYNWVSSGPGDDPPESVIVMEQCTATAGGSDYGSDAPQVSALNGLHDTPQSTTTPIMSGPYKIGTQASTTSQGTHYRVVAGQSPLPLRCTPSASSTVVNGPCSASVTYSASVSPVTIQLTGTTIDSSGGDNVLVGQHCGASLTGMPSACAISYQWSVSGTTFQTWSSDTPAIGDSPYNPDASYYVDGPGPLTSPTAGWYWNDLNKTTETVSCTATLTPPAGQGAAFTVTATKQVTVWVPKLVAHGTGSSVYVDLGDLSGAGSDYYLRAGGVAGSGVPGMAFDASITSPNSSLFGDGSLILVQLAIPNGSYEPESDAEEYWSENGQEGLDTQFPYPWAQGRPDYQTSDSPGIDLTTNPEPGPYGALAGHVNDQFEDYFMYFAPDSSQCVPVGHFVWSVSGNATRPNPGDWPAFGSGATGTVTPSTYTKVPLSNSFPMWTQIDGNGDWE